MMKVIIIIIINFGFLNIYLYSWSHASQFTTKINKSPVKWGEPFNITVTAKNPLNLTVQGGITISFSSNLIITKNDPEAKIYYEGSKVFKKGHICCVSTKDIMVENWYRQWRPHENKTMHLSVFVIKTGVMKIFSRAAFIENIRKKKIVNLPIKSRIIDQQKYPVQVSHVLVEESENFLRNFQLLVSQTNIANSQEFANNLQRLIYNPRDQKALKYFGIHNLKNSPDYLTQLTKLIKDKDVLNSPDLMKYLKILINDPLNAEALSFFGIKLKKERSHGFSQRILTNARRDAEAYINAQKSGTTLISILTSEGDIFFSPSSLDGYITLGHDGRYYNFKKNHDIALRIAEKMKEIKPGSDYIDHEEPFSRRSYKNIIDGFY